MNFTTRASCQLRSSAWAELYNYFNGMEDCKAVLIMVVPNLDKFQSRQGPTFAKNIGKLKGFTLRQKHVRTIVIMREIPIDKHGLPRTNPYKAGSLHFRQNSMGSEEGWRILGGVGARGREASERVEEEWV